MRLPKEDPLRYGFDLPGWSRMRNALDKYDEVITLVGVIEVVRPRAVPRWSWKAVTTNMDGHVVCFSQNADTSVKVQQGCNLGDDAQGVQKEDQEY